MKIYYGCNGSNAPIETKPIIDMIKAVPNSEVVMTQKADARVHKSDEDASKKVINALLKDAKVFVVLEKHAKKCENDESLMGLEVKEAMKSGIPILVVLRWTSDSVPKFIADGAKGKVLTSMWSKAEIINQITSL